MLFCWFIVLFFFSVQPDRHSAWFLSMLYFWVASSCCTHHCHLQKGGPWLWISFNTLRPIQNGRHFADDIFKCIFLNENVLIPIKISRKFVPEGPIDNIPALVQIMAWRRPGDKLLSELMMVSLTTHICVTRPQWVKAIMTDYIHYNVWNEIIH